MNYATNFALVEDGVVTNVAWGMIYNMDEFPGAVQADDLPVQAGDTYDGMHFYHDGARVLTIREQYEADLSEIAAELEDGAE